MQLTGAEIVIECLKEQGVDTVFGYPGGTILNVYDALYKHADEINHILTSHEQGAAHAADGYARATGKVGVCMATSGPGATNLVTGIATAYMDSIPIVAITANVNLPALGKDSFQEVDIAGVTMPITKHGYIVKDINVLADTIRKAFQIAQSGRPGPVLVDITKDVTANTCEYTYQPAVKPVYENKYTEEQLDELWKAARNFEDTMSEGNLVRLAEADVAFHEVIYKSSDNRRLNQVLNNLREQIYRYRVEYLKDEETRNLLVKEHEEIYEAIKNRDLKKAQEITYQHIENQREAIIRSIREENQDR